MGMWGNVLRVLKVYTGNGIEKRNAQEDRWSSVMRERVVRGKH